MYIETQWINVTIGVGLIIASCAIMAAQARRQKNHQPQRSRLHGSLIPGLLGGMIVISETPRLLGIGAEYLTISDMVANALGIAALLLALRAVIILCFRLLRSAFTRMQASATR